MTDLTTTHLQHLLNQSTTGPWEAKDSDCITSEHGEVLWNADQAVNWNRNDHDVNLAAAAPQLAQEVLRMRRELNSIRRAWLLMIDDPEHTPTEQNFAMYVVDHIDSVLGETDE